MERIVIKHQTGSKANQTEAFSLADFKDITFGRDSSVEVKYDPDRDDLVSRQHARITRDADNPGQFILTDLNSRNGTFVNKSRISSPYRLHHGDRVQFGPDGPELIFELDPPPANSAKQTRMTFDASGGQTTREIPPELRERKTSGSESRQPGRVTSLERRIEEEHYEMEDRLEREKEAVQNKLNVEKQVLNAQLKQEKSASRWRLVYVAAGLFCVGVIGAGIFFYRDLKQQDQILAQQQQLAEAQKTAAQAGSEIKAMKEVMTPQKIAEAYSKSTVLITSHWEYVDEFGSKMYHMHVDDKGKPNNVGKPAYVRYNNLIEPMPTFSANEGKAFGSVIRGSGFAVPEQGFILTNRHVAAPWLYIDSKLFDYNVDGELDDGVLVDLDHPKSKDFIRPLKQYSEDYKKLKSWSGRTSALFSPEFFQKQLKITSKAIGKHLLLDVYFPKATIPYPARVVRESNVTDVALLKIDVIEPILGIPPEEDEELVKPGDAVTVIGYPTISRDSQKIISSKDVLNPGATLQEIYEPTLASGWVGKIYKTQVFGNNKGQSETDTYQLTINSTGAGNSGGPVFNDKGKVIGIFTYLLQRDGITVSEAIPIKYGRDLRANPSE